MYGWSNHVESQRVNQRVHQSHNYDYLNTGNWPRSFNNGNGNWNHSWDNGDGNWGRSWGKTWNGGNGNWSQAWGQSQSWSKRY